MDYLIARFLVIRADFTTGFQTIQDRFNKKMCWFNSCSIGMLFLYSNHNHPSTYESAACWFRDNLCRNQILTYQFGLNRPV